MFCEKCGAVAPDGSQFCNHCGHAFSSSVPPLPVATAVPPPTQVVPPAPDAPTSGKALASMITGIFGLLFFFPPSPRLFSDTSRAPRSRKVTDASRVAAWLSPGW